MVRDDGHSIKKIGNIVVANFKVYLYDDFDAMGQLISGMPLSPISGFEPIVLIRGTGADLDSGTVFGRISEDTIYPNVTLAKSNTYRISVVYITN